MIPQGTEVIGHGIETIPASGIVTVEALNRKRERKQFVVTNLNAIGGNTMYICDMAGREALPIFPLESKTLETDSPFRVKGTAGESYCVGEVFQAWTPRESNARPADFETPTTPSNTNGEYTPPQSITGGTARPTWYKQP